ncbi:MAG: hypothetical protein ACOC80_16725 [Petrotogales bacterium]
MFERPPEELKEKLKEIEGRKPSEKIESIMNMDLKLEDKVTLCFVLGQMDGLL